YKLIWVIFYLLKRWLNTFWPRFMKKDCLFAKFYKKNTFFQNVWNFSFI
ncbi:unnamed protein product, partial [Staurois parvus]